VEAAREKMDRYVRARYVLRQALIDAPEWRIVSVALLRLANGYYPSRHTGDGSVRAIRRLASTCEPSVGALLLAVASAFEAQPYQTVLATWPEGEYDRLFDECEAEEREARGLPPTRSHLGRRDAKKVEAREARKRQLEEEREARAERKAELRAAWQRQDEEEARE
jgi:hypothetical protein